MTLSMAIEAEAIDLAERTLAGEPYNAKTARIHEGRVTSLSLVIQQAVEAWILENPYEDWYRR